VVRALVIGNEGDNDAGFVGQRAIARGFSLTSLVRETPGEWPSLDGADLVISLGSEWSVYWEHVRPSVEAETALLVDARRRGTPIVGLCFGSQVLARMLGAVVEKSPLAEVGWHQVEPTAAGTGVIEPGPWFEWHYDRWELPTGAELLATNGVSNQAFRLGRIFATQFHPEVTAAMVEAWSGSAGGAAELARMGIEREALLTETEAQSVRSRPLAYALFDHAIEVVTAR
jgi:GMP synthase-like glutamine amidotransferase